MTATKGKEILAIVLLLCFPSFGFAQPGRSIIPMPNHLEWGIDSFTFSSCTRLQYDVQDADLSNALAPLVNKLKRAAGIKFSNSDSCSNNQVIVEISSSPASGEAYFLQVQRHAIHIRAAAPAGIFYAVQSLLQLLPHQIESAEKINEINWSVPAVTIKDTPRFAYRGLMLDVARHFMPVDSVKRLIDLLALHKINRLHWHLTDNDGWRFESKHYPKLTAIGAYRKGSPAGNNITFDYASLPHDTLYGNYYTVEQMKDVVQYAASRFVTIIPEIEMPAHAMAAIAAYPILACSDSTGSPFRYPAEIQGEFCTRDEVFSFIDTVLAEVMNIFPSPYIHIGGDEAEKANWKNCVYCRQRMQQEGLKHVDELQSYFIKRIEQFVNSRGRNIIGWDEIMQGGIAPNAAVMSWTGEVNGWKAASQGHRVVMSPLPYCYFDHFQASDAGEPIAYPGLTRLIDVYRYNPLPPNIPADVAVNIAGVQANLWTEYIPTTAKADYMLFPRTAALAEVAWTQPALKDYDGFVTRLDRFKKHLDGYGVNYSKHVHDLWIGNLTKTKNGWSVPVTTSLKNDTIHYTLDGSVPGFASSVYKGPIPIAKTTLLTVAAFRNGEITDVQTKKYILHKGIGAIGTTATHPDYQLGLQDSWHNGCLADDYRMNDYRFEDETRYNDDHWLGWDDKPFIGTLDFGKKEQLTKVTLRFFHNVPFGILVPKKITVESSNDGINFREIYTQTVAYPNSDGAVTLPVALQQVTTRYIRIVAEPFGKTPAGNNAYLFIDEVIVE